MTNLICHFPVLQQTIRDFVDCDSTSYIVRKSHMFWLCYKTMQNSLNENI